MDSWTKDNMNKRPAARWRRDKAIKNLKEIVLKQKK